MKIRIGLLRPFVELIAIVGGVEVLVMFLLPVIAPGVEGASEAVLDATLLSIGASPLLLWRMMAWSRAASEQEASAEAQQDSLATSLTVGAAAGGACLGLIVALVLSARHEAEIRRDFDVLTHSTLPELQREVSQPLYALEGAAGVYAASKSVERSEFAAFAASCDPERVFPSVAGFGVIKHVRPAGVTAFEEAERKDECPDFAAKPSSSQGGHWFVKFMEPAAKYSASLGADLASEAGFERVISAAIAGNQPRMATSQVTPWGKNPLAVWFVPVMKKGAAPQTPEQRLESLDVVVFAAFDPVKASAEYLGSHPEIAAMTVRDAQGRVFATVGEKPHLASGDMTSSASLSVGGQKLHITTAASAEFIHSQGTLLPALVGIGITLVSWLLGGIFWSMASSRRRAVSLARSMTADLAAANQRFELAVEGSQDAIFDWDIGCQEVFFSRRWATLLGRDLKDIAPRIDTLLSHVASSDVQRVEVMLVEFLQGTSTQLEAEFRLMSSDGKVRWVLLRAAAMRMASGFAKRVSGSVSDISSIKAVEEEMRMLVQRDQLTGLASRTRLLERLDHALAKHKKTGLHCAILFFDFDRFKVVNDSLGHDVGDELLRSIAKRLQANISEDDTAARFGGDEFVILLEDLASASEARKVADKLLEVCAVPHQIRGHRLVSTASIGVVTTELSDAGRAEMLRDADAAMYQAKSTGRGRVVEFDKAMHDANLERLAIEEEIREALDTDQFKFYFEPIVNLDTGRPVAAEALARWEHPTRGRVSPSVFIPIAEEANLIQELGSNFIRRVCAQILSWKSRKIIPPGFTISVNLSRSQLIMPGFASNFVRTVRESGIEPADLKLEVTETTIVDNRSGVAEVLAELRKHGFVVMMDDFGTGHSSLSGLHALPIDELKIDQSFIRNADVNRGIIAITSSIVNLASNLSLRTIGEGVESMSHIALLQSLGCECGQGHYFSAALPAHEFERWLATRVDPSVPIRRASA